MKQWASRPLLLLVLVLIAAALLYGLLSVRAADDYAVVDPSMVKTATGKGSAKDELKVGVLYISDPAEGAGYTYTHDIGIQEMQRNLGLKDEQIFRKKNIGDSDIPAIENAVQECVSSGCQIIFATSFGYMDTIARLAEKYPSVCFLHASGYKSNAVNFNNYFGRIYQPRYLSGMAAGLKTKSGRIGYVAAMDERNAEVTGGIDAFAMGVYAVNPSAKVYVKVTDSWFSPVKEKAAAEALLAAGCDVFSQHCDTAFPLELAEARGVWGVGYNSDMRRQTPKAALVSVVWHWGAYYTDVTQKIMDGDWDHSNYYGGMAEGIVGLTELSDENSAEAKERVAAAEKQMLSGNLPVFTGVIETNTGATVGQAGQDFSDAEITGGIHWYFKNVERLP